MKINEKNLCTFATTPPYDLEGFLNKRGEVNKAWQKRYFVLKGNLLFYFEKKGEKEPLGLIIVEGCTIELSEDGEPYSFQIVFNGNRTYTLSAESQNIMEHWMKCLTCAGYEYKKLMVAELQRQLEEIEGTQKKHIPEQIQPVAPKPPPRRQNPFNRPAPPPPVFNSSVANNNVQVQAPTTTVIGGRNIDPNNSRFGDGHGQMIHNIDGDVFSFRTVHEAFTEHILADIKNRHILKEQAAKPLIIL